MALVGKDGNFVSLHPGYPFKQYTDTSDIEYGRKYSRL